MEILKHPQDKLVPSQQSHPPPPQLTKTYIYCSGNYKTELSTFQVVLNSNIIT
uniref:Uncharacterized protein n=1 Tax=Rhizophora mucronata TaxID=61149 RepID=A0A2P2Q728_RHIMU